MSTEQISSHQQKLAAAIKYLRVGGDFRVRTDTKYLIDVGCTFKRTTAFDTDVASTIKEGRI